MSKQHDMRKYSVCVIVAVFMYVHTCAWKCVIPHIFSKSEESEDVSFTYKSHYPQGK
jgi:hypothetical protein